MGLILVRKQASGEEGMRRFLRYLGLSEVEAVALLKLKFPGRQGFAVKSFSSSVELPAEPYLRVRSCRRDSPLQDQHLEGRTKKLTEIDQQKERSKKKTITSLCRIKAGIQRVHHKG